MPTPKSKRTYVLQSSNHDSGSGSLRDAVADSKNDSSESDGADTLLGNYSEPSRETKQFNGFPGLSISGHNTSRVILTGEGYSDGNNSLESGGQDTVFGGERPDTLTGDYSETSPSVTIITLPPQPSYTKPSFTDTLDNELLFPRVKVFDGNTIQFASSLANKTITSGQLFLSQPVESGGIGPLASESIIKLY